MVKVRVRNPQVTKLLKLNIDLGVAYDDDLLKPKDFLDFLKSNMKINGKKGNLGRNDTTTMTRAQRFLLALRGREYQVGMHGRNGGFYFCCYAMIALRRFGFVD